MRTSSYYNRIITSLVQLHKTHPKYTMGQHLSTILDGYKDTWGMSDKEMLFAVEKYVAELEYDIPHPEDDIDDLIRQGMNLGSIIEEYNNEYEE